MTMTMWVKAKIMTVGNKVIIFIQNAGDNNRLTFKQNLYKLVYRYHHDPINDVQEFEYENFFN